MVILASTIQPSRIRAERGQRLQWRPTQRLPQVGHRQQEAAGSRGPVSLPQPGPQADLPGHHGTFYAGIL